MNSNKLQAVAEYREHGPTSANSEHPLLMKALLTGSVVFADKWNSIPSLGGHWPIATETALRFPATLFGALSALLNLLVGRRIVWRGGRIDRRGACGHLIPWPSDSIASRKKTLSSCSFFLLGNLLWLHGQRVAETKSTAEGEKYYWLAAAAFGALMASKYVPQLLTVTICYYYIFQNVSRHSLAFGKNTTVEVLRSHSS